jgi:prepilin peptidase CpaA
MELWLNPKVIMTIVLLVICVVTDLRLKKVLNSVLSAAAVIAIAAILVIDGRSGLWPAFGSLVAAIVFALPLYVLKALGAGDVKLLLVISLFLTWDQVATMIVAALAWGSLLGIFRVILAGGFKQFISNLISILMRRKSQTLVLTQIPFTVAIFFGFLTALSLSSVGVSWF